MIARVHSSILQGTDAIAGEVEADVARGGIGELKPVGMAGVFADESRYDVDFADVRGQESAKRALTIAAASHHNPDEHRESARRDRARPCTLTDLRADDAAAGSAANAAT
jgi:hypothetical protein